MALQLMKLVVSASSTITTAPNVQKFFYVTTSLIIGGGTLTIGAASFFNDNGAAVTALPDLTTDNSYFNVYVNGVLQMQGLLTYTPGAAGTGSLEIDVPVGSTSILIGTPVVLEVVNFDPQASTTVET